MIDNRDTTRASGLSGKKQSWIVWNTDYTIVSEGVTAFEAWRASAAVLWRMTGKSVPFSGVHVSEPSDYARMIYSHVSKEWEE